MRALIVLALLDLAACHRGGRDEGLARAVMAANCAGCHVIPGVARAVGRVGPELEHIGRQQLIGGRLPTSRANLAYWLGHAQDVDPGGAMPNIALTDRQAFAAADYLLSTDNYR